MADIKIPEIKAPEHLGTGRRKSAVARVRPMKRSGKILMIGGRSFENYFPLESLRVVVSQPLTATGTAEKYDAVISVAGAGPPARPAPSVTAWPALC